MRIRHCVECSRCRTRYLVSLSPYRNGSYLNPTLQGSLEQFALYCTCSTAAPPSLWRWSEMMTCDVSNAAYDRGYGTSEEITAMNFRPRTMRKTQTIFALLPLAVLLLPTGPLADKNPPEHYVSPWKTPWTYDGADHWSEVDPAYAACNTGKEQSPIDIENTQKAELPPLRFEDEITPLKYVVNNGHTIRVNYHEGNGNFLLLGDQRYELMQFHFHHPSEEFINGKPYDMVVHLMYQASDGYVAAVAVLLQAGRPNPTIQQIWEHMPASEGQNEVDGVELSPAGLLPPTSRRGPLAYYTYAGSQTAPPCTEGVMWFVLKTPLEVSAEQISAFAKLYPRDVRPVQPLNGRVVKESR